VLSPIKIYEISDEKEFAKASAFLNSNVFVDKFVAIVYLYQNYSGLTI